MEETLKSKIRKKDVRKNSRRKRPRAKSVDSCQSGSESSTYEVGRNDLTSIMIYDDATDSDEIMPLLKQEKVKKFLYSRSFSLDRDPQYQFIVYGTSCSFLIGGFDVSTASSKQNSIVTIFAIWNTIIGSSLLAMPWSIDRAGLALALILMLIVSTLAVYTAYRLLNVQLNHGETDIGDVPHLCKTLLGSWAEVISRVSSLITIFGANIVYWILMTNCLYHFVRYIVGTNAKDIGLLH